MAWMVKWLGPAALFFSSGRRHTMYWRDWSSDVCSSDLGTGAAGTAAGVGRRRAISVLCRALQHTLIESFVFRNDPARTEAGLRFPARNFSHLAEAVFVRKNLDGAAGHGFHIAHRRKKTTAAMLNDLRNTTNGGGDGRDFTCHALQRRQAKRFHFTWYHHQVGNGKLFVDAINLSQEFHLLAQALLVNQPLGPGAVGAISHEQQPRRNFFLHAIENLYDIAKPFHRPKVGNMHKNALIRTGKF